MDDYFVMFVGFMNMILRLVQMGLKMLMMERVVNVNIRTLSQTITMVDGLMD